MRIILLTVFLLFLTVNIFSKDLPIRFYVANHKAECTGIIKQMCYLLKNSPKGEWKNYSGTIEGFDYEQGYEYEILVNKKEIENLPADAPSFVYKLVSIVKKTPTMVISESNREMLGGNTFYISRIRMDHGLHYIENYSDCYINFDLNENRISGKDDCNNIMGEVTINGVKISFNILATTRMMCDNIKTDRIFHQLISKVDKYKLKNNKLKLYEGKKLLLEYFIPEVKPE